MESTVGREIPGNAAPEDPRLHDGARDSLGYHYTFQQTTISIGRNNERAPDFFELWEP